MKTAELKKQALEIYKEKGLKSMRIFLEKNAKNLTEETIVFGLETNKQAKNDKFNFLNESAENEIRTHYYCVAKKSRKNGFTYNVLRGKKFKF